MKTSAPYLLLFLLAIFAHGAETNSVDSPSSSKLSDISPMLAENGQTNINEPQRANKLSEMSLEQLMNIEVTSVSKRPEKLADTPAALYVVTQDDIDRSGIKTLPELFRMVPGTNVQQVNNHTWSIGIRGFASEFSNKLLVLIDGREVYTPTFGGVFWEQQDIPLNDIDRIEIIRGPGATIYGANAVNGVINITTKSAKDTQGGYIGADAGNALQGGTIRYGGKINKDAYWRAYFKDVYYNETTVKTGDALDSSDQARGGFRVDWDPNESNLVTVQGDFSQGTTTQQQNDTLLAPPFLRPFENEYRMDGENILARWTHTNSSDSKTTVQLYYDRARHRAYDISETTNKIDLDINHTFNWGDSQQIIVGGGYRREMIDIANSFNIGFIPNRNEDNKFNIFVQDDVTIIKDKLHFIAGAKIEHNDLTGFEGEPSARILWTPVKEQTVWAAVSRAVRIPSFSDRSLYVNTAAFQPPFSPPILAQLQGNPSFNSEDLVAYEIGHRWEAMKTLFFDTSAYYNVYDGLSDSQSLSAFPATSPKPAHLVLPLRFENAISGEIYGVEFAPTWRPVEWWKLTGSYSLYQPHLRSFVSATGAQSTAQSYPQQMLSLRSYIDLPNHFSFDVFAYYVDKISASGQAGSSLSIPQYIRLDARLGWHPREDLEVSVGIQNALDNKHPEGASPLTPGTEVPRTYYVSTEWKF